MSDILVVVSKIKKFIKDESGMNTSTSALALLTEIVKKECKKAIDRAADDGRKTVMDRDFSPNIPIPE